MCFRVGGVGWRELFVVWLFVFGAGGGGGGGCVGCYGVWFCDFRCLAGS